MAKYSYMECWRILSKMCTDIHWNQYIETKARKTRESIAIGQLFALCQKADKEDKNG